MTLTKFRAQNHPQQVRAAGPKDAVDDRGTDPAFITLLEERFGPFNLDVAASDRNHKAPHYYTLVDDGLARPWFGQVWCNPPFSSIEPWVRKAWAEDGRAGGPTLIAMLLPANRCEQRWWQDLIEPHRDRPGSPLSVEFLAGRMRFDRPDAVIGPKGDRPPFGCCLLTWTDENR